MIYPIVESIYNSSRSTRKFNDIVEIEGTVECIHFKILKRIQNRTHPEVTLVGILCQHSKNCAKIRKL
jgi:hypothetical protein